LDGSPRAGAGARLQAKLSILVGALVVITVAGALYYVAAATGFNLEI
jgi:hypothetical protein